MKHGGRQQNKSQDEIRTEQRTNEIKMKKFEKVDGKYDYLLNIKTYEYSYESIQELTEETNKMTEKINTLKKTSHSSMWKTDILQC